MFPHERSLVERLRGRPFILLGVNSDESPTRSPEHEGVITWRSWKDGGQVHGGRIAQRWNVQALPTVFLIDAKGVIRHKIGPRPDDHGSPFLIDARGEPRGRWQCRADEALEVAEALVLEAERDGAAALAGAAGPARPRVESGLTEESADP